MTSFSSRLLRVALLFGMGQVFVWAAEAPPGIDDFFGLPSVRSPRLSPDGKKIAFLFPLENRLALGLLDLKSKKSQLVVRGSDESLVSFFWKGDEQLIFTADFHGNESFFVGVTDLTGKKVMRIVETEPSNPRIYTPAGTIIDNLPYDLDHIAMQLGETISKVNVHNRGTSPLYRYGYERIRDLIVDNAGVVRLRSRIEHGALVWEHRRNDGQNWREIARHPFHGYAETWEPLFFAANNVQLYLISREEHDRGALYTYNTETRQRSLAIFVPPQGEIDNIIASHDRSRLLGVSYESDRLHYHWLDNARERLQASLEETFKGSEVRIVSQSDDENVMLVWVAHDLEPGSYFVLDRAAHTLELFKHLRNIDPAQLRPRKAITYTARDGLPIEGYLTLPAGSEGHRVPLIMHPHGGPFGVRDSWGYDPEAQFLASRGYAVLQPNYRGSGGYGREFINRGRQQWGRAMQDDLSDGVKWAIDQGIADPKHVAIYGASYGGYAALAGVTLTPELYCCAVNYVGPSDLEITFHDRGSDAYMSDDDFSYQREWVGPTPEYRAATSPVNLVERIRVPTLHAYGLKDPRVKIDHWERLEPLLKKYGKPYETVYEKQQGHGFRDQKASIGFHSKLEAFLAKYLAAEPIPVPAHSTQ